MAVTSGVNITYKVLYNDAVAMTGGQPMDGPLIVPRITLQLHAEGVKRIAVVTDEPDKYPSGTEFAPGVQVHHRDRPDAGQTELREGEGVSAIVHDQTSPAAHTPRPKRGP